MTTTSSLNSILSSILLRSVRAELREQPVELLEALLHPVGHAAVDHRVAGLDGLVHGVRAGERPAVAEVDQLHAVERDVARSAVELERLEHRVRRLRAVEHAAEAVLRAVLLDVG